MRRRVWTTVRLRFRTVPLRLPPRGVLVPWVSRPLLWHVYGRVPWLSPTQAPAFEAAARAWWEDYLEPLVGTEARRRLGVNLPADWPVQATYCATVLDWTRRCPLALRLAWHKLLEEEMEGHFEQMCHDWGVRNEYYGHVVKRWH